MKSLYTILTPLSVLSVLLIGMSSCSHEPKDPVTLAGTDTLLKSLKHADSLFRSIEADEVEERAEHVKSNRDYYKPAILKAGDTLDYATVQLLTEYEEAYGIFEEYGEDRKSLLAAIDSSTASLSNLAHDLRENTLAEGLNARKCLNDERVKVTKIADHVGIIVPAVHYNIRMYDSLAPHVQEYMKVLAAKIAAKETAPKK